MSFWSEIKARNGFAESWMLALLLSFISVVTCILLFPYDADTIFPATWFVIALLLDGSPSSLLRLASAAFAVAVCWADCC
jgi:hypothetical protein